MRKPPSNSRINVLLVDDYAQARENQRRMLASDVRLQILGAPIDVPALPTQAPGLEPDVIVVDISLPGMSGIDTLRQVVDTRPPAARVLMFSQYQDPLYVARAFDAGAHGFLTKANAPEMLLAAIKTVASGQRFMSPDVQRAMSERGPEVHKIAKALTRREHEVLRLLSAGRNLPEIARQLGISTKTVANRQTAIKRKLGAGSAVQLMVVAQRLGLSPAGGEPPTAKHDT